MKLAIVALHLVLALATSTNAQSGNLNYLGENNPWYPGTGFPKLITPQWVGEDGVEAVVVLAIDDMRDTARYEAYLRPILQRLKQIDGRAPVSIMTNSVQPDDTRLQTWLDEGLSIEVHTIDHPCPLLNGGNFARAKSTYDRCVDLLGQIKRNKPVAYRMPCCDSLNTVSSRFYSEIMGKTTENGNFLSISSSVFNLFTPADKSIPRELLFDKNGRERFRKYVPHQSNTAPKFRFNNLIENYPYPYVVNNTCWEFPCVVPSDWEAQNLHRPNNPITVDDMKAALDITVHKQGVYCLVFHPHGWIQNSQVIDLIDHAVKKHGRKVKFLTFPEALQRLNEHLLAGQSIRDNKGNDNGVRLVDINVDGYLDVVIGNDQKKVSRVWDARQRSFTQADFYSKVTKPTTVTEQREIPWFTGSQFLSMSDHGTAKFVHIRPPFGGASRPVGLQRSRRTCQNNTAASSIVPPLFVARRYEKGQWGDDKPLTDLLHNHVKYGQEHPKGILVNLHFHQISEHGQSVAIATYHKKGEPDHSSQVFMWNAKPGQWETIRATLPAEFANGLAEPSHARIRFVDIDEDGVDDLVLSPKPTADNPNPKLELWLMDWLANGKATAITIPDGVRTMPIARADGSDNGFFVRDRHFYWQNEDTNSLPNLLHRASFDSLLHDHYAERARQGEFPPPRTPEQSAALIQVRPGLRVELVAAEPLIRDPVAYDWDVSGRLWVVEMGGYPNGTDGKGQGGGRIRVLTDRDKDGRYDHAVTFLDGLNFPTGIQLWREGVLITAAPEVIYAADTNGDLKADEKKTLYRGFVEGNQQHRVNGLRYGLDNWLYLANGDSGGVIEVTGVLGDKIAWRELNKEISISGRDLRIQPDKGWLDAQSGQTQFGRNRDDWGNWFGCNNSQPMWHYVLADHYIRRNPHAAVRTTRYGVPAVPGAAPVFPISRTLPRYNDFANINRFTSACSTIVYRDNLLGDKFYGNAFISEPVHNLVSRLVLTKRNGQFVGNRAADEAESEFLASRDNWFRPTMLRTGPDGALWIADMYRAVIEHPKWIPADWQARMDLRAGSSLGRIYKVVPETVVDCCKPMPDLAAGRAENGADSGDLNRTTNATDDEEAETRCFAESVKLSSAELVQRLSSPNGWWRDTAQRMLVHRRDRSVVKQITRIVTSHQNALARLHALCTLDGMEALNPATLVVALRDKHPGVRRHAVRIAEPLINEDLQIGVAIADLLDEQDDAVLMQLAYSVANMKGEGSALLLARLAADGSKPWIQAAAISSLNGNNIQGVLNAAMKVHADANLTSNSSLAQLLGQAAAFGKVDAIRKPWYDLLPRETGALSAAKWAMLTSVTREFQRNQKLWDGLQESKDAQGRLKSAFEIALATVTDAKNSDDRRVAALEFVGLFGRKDEKTLASITKLIVPQSSFELQQAAVSALSNSGEKDTVDRLLAGWQGHSPALRNTILDSLLQQSGYRDGVLDAIKKKTIGSLEIDAIRRERLLTTGSDEQRKRASVLLAATNSATRQAVVDQYKNVLQLKGDVVNGKRVFTKRCATCHRLSGIGKTVGADLTSLRDRSGQALLTAILNPNRAVESKFLSFTAITNQGRSYSGMLFAETANSITLNSADGKQHTILRKDLDSLVGSNRSLMPEGFEKDLSRQDMADVIQFVQSNAVPRKRFPGNEPRVISANAKGELRIPASAAEIYGPAIVFEQQFKNLGYWSHKDDHAEWTIHIAKGGRYRVDFDFACHEGSHNNEVEIRIGDKSLKGRVPSTQVWENYRVWKLGELEIPAGTTRINVLPTGPPKSAMIDLRTIVLTPLK